MCVCAFVPVWLCACVCGFPVQLFNKSLVPKKVHGRQVTGPELERFVVSYCKLFQDASNFPAATDLLTATAEVNNRNARDAAFTKYKAEMDKVAGHGCSFMQESQLKNINAASRKLALQMFDEAANFGHRRDIREHRRALLGQMDAAFVGYKHSNRDR